jgi:tetratricopeptide (TPR) repeat protein
VEEAWTSNVMDEEAARRCWLLTSVTARALLEKGPALIQSFVPANGLCQRAFQTAFNAAGWLDRLSEICRRYELAPALSVTSEDGVFHQYLSVLKQVSQTTLLIIFLDDLLEMHEYTKELENGYLHAWVCFVIAWHYFLEQDFTQAHFYNLEVLEIIRTKNFVGKPLETTLAQNAGILEKLGQFDEAERYYRQAESLIRTEKEQGYLRLALAGLARIALQRCDLSTAKKYTEEMLPLLNPCKIYSHGTIMASYLISYQVLSACGDDRAVSVLERAVEKMHDTALKIKDNQWRRMFYECNHFNLELLAESRKIFMKVLGIAVP